MSVEYTGRQTEITPKIRKAVESGLAKINKILGGQSDAKVVLTVEKHLHKVGIILVAEGHTVTGVGRGVELNTAIAEALEHIASQATKQKDRISAAKRRVVKPAWKNSESAQELPSGNPRPRKAAVDMVVHKFPAKTKTTEAHLVYATDRVALRPMSLEEAVKEAEFRDHDVFVFRNPQGKTIVLHRTKDGKIEVIEAP